MLFVFCLLILGSAYSYLVYPLLLLLITRFGAVRSEAATGAAPSTLSVIVTARNEAARIGDKLEDILQHAPSELLEIIVVSDASEDDTDKIVRGHRDVRVRLLRQESRDGKEAGQRRGILAASGDVLIFSDVATRFEPGSIEALLERFADPGVGAVSSEDRFVSGDGVVAGEGLYVRYEMWLRRLESRLAGLVGLSGSFFAVRREVCETWPTDVPSDFTVALNCARRGLRAVSDPRVIGIYPDLKQPADEYARKRRTVLRGMAGLAAAREVLNPFRFGLFAFQAWSHKVMRWAVPWFLLVLLPASILAAPKGMVYAFLLGAQLFGYGLALLGWRVPASRGNSLVRLAFYFCQVNLAMADALIRFLRGERVVTWEPSKR